MADIQAIAQETAERIFERWLETDKAIPHYDYWTASAYGGMLAAISCIKTLGALDECGTNLLLSYELAEPIFMALCDAQLNAEKELENAKQQA